MKFRHLLVLLCTGAFLASCYHHRPPTDISGVINHYAAVKSIDCATLAVDDAPGFHPEQKVLVIQMQGAEIDRTNTRRFGSLLSLGGAGTAEYARIADVDRGTITLERKLLNRYDVDGAVQIVSVPEYRNARVSGPVHARAWNGRTGGVLVLHVEGRLVLDGDIVASEQGFRGGTTVEQTQVPFYYVGDFVGTDRQALGMKGEGVARPSRGDGTFGRGAAANAGGGGNNHNAGGGGGANVGCGGNGGYAYPHSRYSGDREIAQGLGGNELRVRGRLLMGGGGGAGHSNNRTGSDGGNGGGIIIVRAGTIVGQGGAIRSTGGDTETAAYDGAGGAGAGGSIWVHADAQEGGRILLDARGGDGGNTANDVERRHVGAGGGGGGGRVWMSVGRQHDRPDARPFAPGLLPNVSGGTGGITILGSNDGTTDGCAGLVAPTWPIPHGVERCRDRDGDGDDDDDDDSNGRGTDGERGSGIE